MAPLMRRETRTRAVAWFAATVLIVVIGWIDFFSGIELRVYPLYYLPISLLAWHVGRAGALCPPLASPRPHGTWSTGLGAWSIRRRSCGSRTPWCSPCRLRSSAS